MTTPVVHPVLLERLRSDLRAGRFTVDGVAERLGPVASAALHREHPLPAVLRTEAATDPCGVLVRLFTLGRDVTEAQLTGALPSLGARGAVALGLVAAVADGPGPPAGEPLLRARCDLRPYADEASDWWVASDLSEAATRAPLPPDHVLGIGPASTTLASWTIRRPVARALDLGTGCGVQALHLADHADTVTATDVSTRALAYAAFTAALNGVTLELLSGDLLEPVAGRRFDLVVSNPPFVISPRGAATPRYEYRDGGRRGDELVRSLVREVGHVLRPGGVAQFLGNWEVPRGRSWRDVWAGWLDGVGLDAWVIQRDSQDPAEYAELWARDGGALPGTAAHDAMYAAWLDDFASRDVEAIGFGVVTLQRPIGERQPWRDLAEAPGPVASPMGPTLDVGLRARTWLAEHTDDELLDVAWRCAPDVTEERHYRPGSEDPSVIVVRQGGGLGRSVRASTLLAAYVGVADGELAARAALDAIAAVLGLDAGAVRAELLPTVRDLVADGLLVRDGT
ncbi:MAG TPA: methyltransferase [Intrasporangium sp.]|uniref:DUF7059 domain-containing protein n=1 Tax=Intrasporangium sp. TaxID=1925024 RepID=UPI002D76C854|nr:methyltransferase [Intrasporangium sp.]HET7398715.1 methyltransferase [Intrasporangium sp.]